MSPQSTSGHNGHINLLPELLIEGLSSAKADLFPLGQTVHTKAIGIWAEQNLPDALLTGNLWLQILIKAHVTGCWSDLPATDQNLNYRALQKGNADRIFSAYTILDEKIYVITEWGRSCTTVMLASDY